jgi:hypothetical protein
MLLDEQSNARLGGFDHKHCKKAANNTKKDAMQAWKGSIINTEKKPQTIQHKHILFRDLPR